MTSSFLSEEKTSLLSNAYQTFKTALEEANRVLLSTHLLPDGDGLGAETALFHYLKSAQKDCRVYNPDPIPKRYRFLDPDETFLREPQKEELWDHFDLWVIVDTNDPRRLGKLWNELSARTKRIIFLDHHPDIVNDLPAAYPSHTTLVSDPHSSSIGELLYHLFKDLQLSPMNRDIALGLYVSVMTDTNSFRYSRTTPEAHRIAAETIQMGVNPEQVYQAIYSSKEVSHLHLLGCILQNVQITAGGKIAWLEIPLELRKKYHATSDDTQSFLSFLLLLKDAEVVCLFREEGDGKVRVSMKSKGRVIVNQIASKLGGGGHEFAAGLALLQTLEETVRSVIPQIEKEITLKS